MRCFFAIEIPDVVKSEIKVLMNKYPSMQFVNPDNMHLTLFLFALLVRNVRLDHHPTNC